MTEKKRQTRGPGYYLRTLRRRRDYLKGLKDAGEANPYDLAELGALAWAIELVEKKDEVQA